MFLFLLVPFIHILQFGIYEKKFMVISERTQIKKSNYQTRNEFYIEKVDDCFDVYMYELYGIVYDPLSKPLLLFILDFTRQKGTTEELIKEIDQKLKTISQETIF